MSFGFTRSDAPANRQGIALGAGLAPAQHLPDLLVAPGEATIIRCPAVGAVDRTGPSSGMIEYVIVYGDPDAPPALRYRRHHDIWFRFEPADDTVLIAIADPRARDDLERTARDLGYL